MTDFLFHHVSEEEKEKIKKEAEKIMEDFSNKLSKIDEKIPDSLIERDDFEREEVDKDTKDSNFRKHFFENAHSKKRDFIVAERKKW